MEEGESSAGQANECTDTPVDNESPLDTGGTEIQPGERRQLLLAAYKEICKSHAGITDFRAKLLAIIPVVSGTGVGLAVGQLDGEAGLTMVLLLPLGIFGFVVTVGLWFYEVRQIDICKQLRNQAAWMERQLGVEAGQFGGRRQPLRMSQVYRPCIRQKRERCIAKRETSGLRSSKSEKPCRRLLIDAETAGYLIYHAVMIAWLIVAAIGLYVWRLRELVG